MKNKDVIWEIVYKPDSKKGKELKNKDIIAILLDNRGLTTATQRKDFFKSVHPKKITINSLGISAKEISQALRRIQKAIKDKEEILVYGDYDADGICATAILWECLYSYTKKVLPYIPDRFSEGYGLNGESVNKLKTKYPKLKLIITVDNGIVANEAVVKASDLGIDVIVTDHHQKGKKLPKAHSIIHTDKISGSGIAWILAREILSKLPAASFQLQNSLQLAGIGTIADQLPLVEVNRSFAKYGLEELNRTKRVGLLALFAEAGLDTFKDTVLHGRGIGTYEVNFVIAPRINAMGRLEHAIDSLRLLCTKSYEKARELAKYIGKTNRERQRVVDEVVFHARDIAQKSIWKGAIVLAHESYHEGVIGLAAAKLVEEFYRPAIVFARGEKISKASARSISGFNIIESIRKLDSIILGGGGHPMAAGFSIETKKIKIFQEKFEKIAEKLLTDDLLTKKLKIDCELSFALIDESLVAKLKEFDPSGIGNPTPTFATRRVRLVDARTVGQEGKHLKIVIEKDGHIFQAIGFGWGNFFSNILQEGFYDIAFTVEENIWNGSTNIQLKIKDIKVSN